MKTLTKLTDTLIHHIISTIKIKQMLLLTTILHVKAGPQLGGARGYFAPGGKI
jgi:hypothetical protein